MTVMRRWELVCGSATGTRKSASQQVTIEDNSSGTGNEESQERKQRRRLCWTSLVES